MLLALVAVAASAQELLQRRPCMRFPENTRAQTRVLPTPSQNWDPARTYRQIVLLVEFADSTFSMDDPKTYYNNLLNLTTSNTRGGVGCAVDYFRDQSNGAFNLQFDVYGPIKVSQAAKKSETGDNYGEASVKEAIQKSIDSLHVDYSPYDWNKDGEVEQVCQVRNRAVAHALQPLDSGAARQPDGEQDEGHRQGRHPLHAERHGGRSPSGWRRENRRRFGSSPLCITV